MPREENLFGVRSLNLVCGSVFWYHSDIMILQQSTRKLRSAARAKQWAMAVARRDGRIPFVSEQIHYPLQPREAGPGVIHAQRRVRADERQSRRRRTETWRSATTRSLSEAAITV
jgi:hypothetical protein